MKQVCILRHAEASLKSKTDHDRPLTFKGKKDSLNIGKHILDINCIPDLVITSSAIRALSTAKNTISGGKWNSELIVDSKIYGGSPDYLLFLLAKQDNKYESICLVGHEPNFSNFIYMSTNKYVTLKTCSIGIINFNINKWDDITLDNVILSWLINPKSLK
jgi:phosphohistidine phosphatase